MLLTIYLIYDVIIISMYKREVLRMTDYEMLEKLKNCRCGSHNLTIEYIYSRGIYNIYCNDCENEIFTLLANVSDLTVDEIKAFDLTSITKMVVDFVKKEEFKDFIGVVSELFK